MLQKLDLRQEQQVDEAEVGFIHLKNRRGFLTGKEGKLREKKLEGKKT